MRFSGNMVKIEWLRQAAGTYITFPIGESETSNKHCLQGRKKSR